MVDGDESWAVLGAARWGGEGGQKRELQARSFKGKPVGRLVSGSHIHLALAGHGTEPSPAVVDSSKKKKTKSDLRASRPLGRPRTPWQSRTLPVICPSSSTHFLLNSAYPLRPWSLRAERRKEITPTPPRKRGIIRSNLSLAEAEKLAPSFRAQGKSGEGGVAEWGGGEAGRH